MTSIYLDHNATTRTHPEVVAAMLPFFTEQFGNASTLYGMGTESARALRQARQAVAALIGAEKEEEIVFTSGGSESNNTAIRAGLAADPSRREIVTSAVEHPAVLQLCAWLEAREGIKVHRIPVDGHGRLDIEAYRAALSPKTAIVSLMWANNETGTIFPVEGLAELAHEAGALFHTDAVQAVGKVPVTLKGTAIDMLSLSGHKFHGPKGIGALYVRRGTKFQPLIFGGKQERGRRAGTENVPGIVGLGKAAELTMATLVEDIAAIKVLRDRFERDVLGAVERCFVVGDPYDRLPNTATIAFDFVEGEGILLHLDREGIAASSGSACTSGSLEPSHVLKAMAVPFTAAHGAIRFSLGRETTATEIDRVTEALPPIIARLREMSPFWEEDAQETPSSFQSLHA
ncbi:cysteine desulfurase NifS [Consotaella aegiceratis]|uniref:cysteine desulfurase NifS n=1 Tax=Consotaella aegiceratis TaxID=3097961 RepID=UPI002F417C96